MMNKSVKINPKLLVLIFFLMLGLSFASVPLYDLFVELLVLVELRNSQKRSHL